MSALSLPLASLLAIVGADTRCDFSELAAVKSSALMQRSTSDSQVILQEGVDLADLGWDVAEENELRKSDGSTITVQGTFWFGLDGSNDNEFQYVRETSGEAGSKITGEHQGPDGKTGGITFDSDGTGIVGNTYKTTCKSGSTVTWKAQSIGASDDGNFKLVIQVLESEKPTGVIGDLVTWAVADGRCELAQPKTQQEINDIVKSATSKTNIWIGLKCDGGCADKQNWRFSDGSIPDSSFPWEPRQPNAAGAACAGIRGIAKGDNNINDMPCGESYQFACVQAPSPAPSPAPTPAPTPTPDGGAGGEFEQWLSKTNAKRAAHGACPVTWNDVLAADMLAYLKTLTSMKHDNVYKLKPPHGPCGENLAWASNGASVDMAITGWYNEVNDCANPIRTDGCQEPKSGKMVGHFTSMVWKGAREMGCAVFKTFAGCRYMEKDARGLSANTPNMGGHYVKNVGEKDTKATGC